MLTRLLTLCAVLAVLACSEQSGDLSGALSSTEATEVVRPVRAMQLGMQEAFAERKFPGRAEASNEVTLAFEVSGKLNELEVSVGDKVKRGDVLASVDPRDFQNALDQAKAEAKRANSRYQRMQKAFADNAVSAQNVSDAEAAYESTRALLNIRQKALDDTKLLAPYDAIVAATFVDSFGNVRAKQPAVRLVDPSRIEMLADLPESLISFAKEGMKTFVRFDVFPDLIIPAVVKEVGSEASETTRTYPVTMIMDQPEGATILPGMAGEAWPSLEEYSAELAPEGFHGFVVPVSAILAGNDGKKYVWVIDAQTGRVRKTEVSLGELTTHGVLVQGLDGGLYIATAGVHSLRQGQQVRILKSNLK